MELMRLDRKKNNLLESEGQQVTSYLERLRLALRDGISVRVIRTLSKVKNMALKAELMQQERSWWNREDYKAVESTGEFKNRSNKNNNKYGRNKMAETVGKDKDVRITENPYSKSTMGKCFKCNQPGHKSNKCPLRKTVNIVEKNEEIICELDGDEEEEYEAEKVREHLGRKLKVVRSDCGGEFTSAEFQNYCDDRGIKKEYTAPYTPQQNGVVEHKNRTVVEMARALLKTGNLPTRFWGDAVSTGVYLINRSPTQALQTKTPYEGMHGVKLVVSHLKVFGCIAFTLIPSQKLYKLDERSERCIFTGYSSESKAYKLFNPVTGKIIISRDVVFHEGSRWCWEGPKSNVQVLEFEEDKEEQVNHPQSSPISVRTSSGGVETKMQSKHSDAVSVSRSRVAPTDGTPPRKIKLLTNVYNSYTFAMHVADPTEYMEAVKSKEWQDAMNLEMDSITSNNTWELCELPAEKSPVGLKWIFKTKFNEKGEVQKHKARIVAKGYSQTQGIDYDEEEVYVSQPEGYEKKGEEHLVYRLRKALYGLKQAPRACSHEHETLLCNPVSTPLAVNEKLEEGDSDKFSDPGTYRSLIRKLLYVTHTRPDIIFPVNYLSRFMNQPSKIQFIATKQVVRYLTGTKKLGLWYSRGDDGELEAFSDSDWGGSKVDRKSTSGVFFKLGSCPISWGSRKKDVVALSTTEAEYIASTGAACQVVWLRRVLQNCGKPCSESTKLWVDNLLAIAVAKNPAHHGRTKHIDMRYHFIRGLVSEGVISLHHFSTKDQIADIFTKPLLTKKFVMFRSLLGMRSSQSRGDVDVD
ncbi:uncharacterized protein LOC120250711 [Dioscorea cayenensis subsp. rotundata]|uniref:Uncharacterized protein LOC120250711 n=1 Tax=Dioscorea cayennensis subsp. rotundata TaxID=55577 RepID=A0AB40AMK7_DIOCR|nr:uncharacterized protein LOC120250711 [Dioscorea cayenensis subsp. rotundata]